MIFKRISETEFNNLNHLLLFQNESNKYDRSFGEIICHNNSFKFAWNSTIIDPIILKLENDKICIGIDQKFVILNCRKCIIETLQITDYFIIDIVKTNGLIFICTELEVIVYKIGDIVPFYVIELHEIFDKLIVNKNQIVIKCLNEYEFKFSLEEVINFDKRE